MVGVRTRVGVSADTVVVCAVHAVHDIFTSRDSCIVVTHPLSLSHTHVHTTKTMHRVVLFTFSPWGALT